MIFFFLRGNVLHYKIWNTIGVGLAVGDNDNCDNDN